MRSSSHTVLVVGSTGSSGSLVVVDAARARLLVLAPTPDTGIDGFRDAGTLPTAGEPSDVRADLDALRAA